MKALLAGLILMSTNALAHGPSFSNGSTSCDVDINGGIRISESSIDFLKNDELLYQITASGSLNINNNDIFLDDEQQEVVTEYAHEIRALVPQVKNLAIDALTLASDGVNLAFTELLGPQNTLGAELQVYFNDISDEIEQSFASNKPIHFNENGFSGTEFFGEDFEQRIESAVEETVQKSIGSLMIAIGQELLFSEEGVESFEAKMERFGNKIATEMEIRASKVESNAQALCFAITNIDNIEEKLKHAVNELSDTDMLTVKITQSDAI